MFLVQFFVANFADIVVVLVIVVAVIAGDAVGDFGTFIFHLSFAVRWFVGFLVEIVEQKVEENGIW